MEFEDTYINKDHRFSLGKELESGKYYLSIPVSNQMVDYEEYYEIPKDIITQYPSNLNTILEIIDKCKKHKNDTALIIKPGRDRGVS